MKRYFDTREAAERHLEWRKKCAYSRIEKSGDKVLMDTSHVYKDFKWSKYDPSLGGIGGVTQTNIEKWFVFMGITTEQMIKDLQTLHNIDVEEELRALIPFTPAEKAWRHNRRAQEFFKIHKTIDNNEHTINKQP